MICKGVNSGIVRLVVLLPSPGFLVVSIFISGSIALLSGTGVPWSTPAVFSSKRVRTTTLLATKGRVRRRAEILHLVPSVCHSCHCVLPTFLCRVSGVFQTTPFLVASVFPRTMNIEPLLDFSPATGDFAPTVGLAFSTNGVRIIRSSSHVHFSP